MEWNGLLSIDLISNYHNVRLLFIQFGVFVLLFCILVFCNCVFICIQAIMYSACSFVDIYIYVYYVVTL